MSNLLRMQGEIYAHVFDLKDSLAVLAAALDRFDAYSNYKPESVEAMGLVADIGHIGHLVQAAVTVAKPAVDKLEVLADEDGGAA